MIIGSTALKHHFPELKREPKDIDLMVPVDSWLLDPPRIHTINRLEVFSHQSLRDAPWEIVSRGVEYKLQGLGVFYATPNELYTIKCSHSYWELKNGSWGKHIADIVFLKERGARLLPDLHDFLYKIWEEVHGKKRVNLQMSAGVFFKDAVKRTYLHDSLHYSVAYGKRPLYEDFLKPGEEIAIDMKAVKEAPFETQVKLFREEVAATALERLVIPANYQYSPGRAWNWALRRTITSLTKGWSAKFIVTNIEHFIKHDNYVQRHLDNADRLIKL